MRRCRHIHPAAPSPQPDAEVDKDPLARFFGGSSIPGHADLIATWRDGRVTNARIGLVTTKPHFGGVRYWFVCPNYGRRAGKLYATEEVREFACRRCWGLVYRSQYRKDWREQYLYVMLNWNQLPTRYRERFGLPKISFQR